MTTNTNANANAILRAFAEGRIQHLNRGQCPDTVSGHDSRDPDCPVCAALSAAAAQPCDSITNAKLLLSASAIQGAIAFGQLGEDPPPDDSAWLRPFHEIGRALAAAPKAEPAPACDTPRYCGSVLRCTAKDEQRAAPAGEYLPLPHPARPGDTASPYQAAKKSYWSEAQVYEAIDADRAMRAQAAPINLQCKSTQKRLATLWGFVPAGEQAAPAAVETHSWNRYCAAGICLETDGVHDTCCQRNATQQPTKPAPAPADVAVPDGWKLVPVEPTQAMLRKADGLTCIDFTALGEEGAFTNDELRAIYQAFLEAAPQPAPVAQGDALTDTYVQQVPDKCDRIVWRGRCYHLPIDAAEHSYTEPSPMAKVAAALRQKAEQEDAAYQARRSDQGLMESEWGPMEDVPLTTQAAPQPAPIFGDEDHVLVPRGLLGAACSAIDKKRDGVKTLAELRRYTTGDLSKAAPQQDDQKPYAYAVYFPDQPTVELVHDLDELTDDLTNREHQITRLYAAPQAAPAAQADAEDAARYRWLREGNDAKHGAAWHVAVNLYGCEWDAAIDAARSQAKEGGS